jgi:luciferase family oxidoreductase group 1
MSEHHAMPGAAIPSPLLMAARLTGETERIRLGAGGIMLPNHVPLRVAETYRTLNGLNPGRIDLGIGRAGGTDGRTLRALRSVGGEYFAQELAELLAFEEGNFAPDHPFHPIRVVPEDVQLPPIWLLGSSGASAQAAGQLGVGYSFAAHFSQTPAAPAFAAYREAFTPTAAFPAPHAILALSALVAPTDEEAAYLSRSQELSWALFHSGDIRKLVSPEQAATHDYTPHQLQIIAQHRPLWIVGSPETVKAEIERKAAESGADEVMITTTNWDYELRLRSYRLLAEAFGL